MCEREYDCSRDSESITMGTVFCWLSHVPVGDNRGDCAMTEPDRMQSGVRR